VARSDAPSFSDTNAQSTMTAPHLPASVVAALTARMHATGRATLAAAQARASAIYRDGGHSRDAVPDATAALAYAIARMSATYAACIRAFDLTAELAPSFAPATMLDLGAGPGTATLAAAAVWPDLTRAHLIEPNAALGAIATDIVATETSIKVALEQRMHLSGSGATAFADLVTLSYVLAEQPEKDVAAFVTRLAASVGGLMIIVEPGTPAGHARILSARAALVAAGLEILAPCPHANACPLPQGDWCHFSVRLQRSAGHRALKDADLSFEDEPFSFVAALRGAVGKRASARLIKRAEIEKGFADLPLCTATGLETRRIKRRDASAYKAAKNLLWGDKVGE
jgi:ribosomal protein RSM22 (predicted rRNA methylase)